MKSFAFVAVLAATFSAVSAQIAIANAGADVNVDVHATAIAIASVAPAYPPAVVTVTVVPAVPAPPPVVYHNNTCPTCLTTTIYTATFVNICPTGLTYIPYVITTACPGGCVINPTICPNGFTTQAVHCSACATPGVVTVTVPVVPALATSTSTTTVSVYACPTTPAAVVVPVVTPGCPGGAACPVLSTRTVYASPGCTGNVCPSAKPSTYLFTGAASSSSIEWKGMAVAIGSIFLGMILL